MEPLHLIALLAGALVAIPIIVWMDLLARWPKWQRFKSYVRERLRGLFRE